MTDPMGTSDPDWGRREPKLDKSRTSFEAEAREIVQRFESRYAELAPQDDAPQRVKTPFDDVLLHGDEMGQAIEWPHDPAPVYRPELMGSTPGSPAADGTDDMALDDALAMLRSAERTQTSGPRDAVDTEEATRARSSVQTRSSVARSTKVSEATPSTDAFPAAPLSPAQHRKTMLPHIAAAAAVALALGVAAGYFGAQLNETRTAATAVTGANAGAGLRIDYELRKR